MIYDKLIKIVLVLASVVFTLVFCEAAAFVYARYYLGYPKVYEFNSELGYAAKASVDVARKVRGEDYFIRYTTGVDGFRVAASDRFIPIDSYWSTKKARILVVGDSFAEGQVEYLDRFDSFINKQSQEFHAIAMGIGGYGTDQQLILAKRFFSKLRKGDIFVLLTCGNDFQDILRSSAFGRLKPWYSGESSKDFQLNLPQPQWWDHLRDQSYLVGYFLQKFDHMQYGFSVDELQRSKDLYKYLVRSYLKPLDDRGVKVIVAHHSSWVVGNLNDVFKDLSSGFNILNLDQFLVRSGDYFIADKFHWNEKANKLVAEVLLEHISTGLMKAGTP